MNAERVILALIENRTTLSIVTMFVVIALWEFLAPTRRPVESITSRWSRNFALSVASAVMTGRWFSLWLVGGFAYLAEYFDVGLFNRITLAWPIVLIVSVVVLDLTHYTLHRLKHDLRWMWSFHRVHHSDRELDVSTHFRVHPFEALLSLLAHTMLVGLLGMPLEAIVAYGLAVYATGFLVHGDLELNQTLDRLLRVLLVTPAMHRVHHSSDISESNSNFGVVFSFWDRILDTYMIPLQSRQDKIEFGLREIRDPQQLTLSRLLLMPFSKDDTQENAATTAAADRSA